MQEKNEAPLEQIGGQISTTVGTEVQENNTRNCAVPQCFSCRFYAEIPLKTGHIRRLCRLTGECNPSIRMAGCVYERAVQGDFGGLTPAPLDGKVELPNNERQSDGLYHAPHDKNSGISVLKCHFPCRKRHEYKLAVTRPEPVRAGGLSLAGERVAAILF